MLPVRKDLPYVSTLVAYRSESTQPSFRHVVYVPLFYWLERFLFCRQGLKTGMYYLRTKPAAQAIQFTVDKKKLENLKATENQKVCIVYELC